MFLYSADELSEICNHDSVNAMNCVKKKIFVGMSGGVDSSVSAALLQRDGYDVTGVFIKVWQADFLPCTWREERRDAMRACAHLGIPFLTLDLEKEYKDEVVDYMIQEYREGRVPNPDVMCNKHVKFGAFLDFALINGADLVATGHYTQIEHPQNLSSYNLLAGVDKEKDQSYFLWTLTQEQLGHIIFPIGHLEKSEVRKLAKEIGLPNADKKDSQGLCFMGKIDMRDFLKHYIKATPGIVVDTKGSSIGTHEGSILYTIGQRHGFQIQTAVADNKPLYVVSKDIDKNVIVVDTKLSQKTMRLDTEVHLVNVNWIPDAEKILGDRNIQARIRYRGTLHNVTILNAVNSEALITFSNLNDFVAPGQSIVFYDLGFCLGGGVIA